MFFVVNWDASRFKQGLTLALTLSLPTLDSRSYSQGKNEALAPQTIIFIIQRRTDSDHFALFSFKGTIISYKSYATHENNCVPPTIHPTVNSKQNYGLGVRALHFSTVRLARQKQATPDHYEGREHRTKGLKRRPTTNY